MLTNSTDAQPQSFSLAGSTISSVLWFYGAVTNIGATSQTVGYTETPGLPANGCSVSPGTVIDTIALTFPTSFDFAPNGSFGANTGLIDTVFSTTQTGPFTGAIYQAGSCRVFSPAQTVFGGVSPFEYPGGGNTSVPAGTYLVEFWK